MSNKPPSQVVALSPASGATHESDEMPYLRLEELMLAAFLRASAEGRSNVAEHLLQALEVVCGNMPAGVPGAASLPSTRDGSKRCH